MCSISHSSLNAALVMSPLRLPCLSPGTPGFGLDLEELAEDCCAVRSQLEYLQRLLLQVRGEEEEHTNSDTLQHVSADEKAKGESVLMMALVF